MTAVAPTPFGTRRRNRKPRDFTKTAYADLPSVLFRDEIRYLYDIIEEQRRQIDTGVQKGVLHARTTKLELAHLREKVNQVRAHTVLLRDTNDRDEALHYVLNRLPEIANGITSIVKSI